MRLCALLTILVKTYILYYFSKSVEATMSSAPPAHQTQPSCMPIPKTAQCRNEVGAAVSEGDPSTCLNDAEVQCQQLVPYEPVRFLPFQDNQREFVFAGKEWVIVQQWNEIGLAAVVWEAAIALCQYLETLDTGVLSGGRVIELGAGTGLAGMVASALGAQSVVLTDRNTASASANLQQNKHNLEGRTITVSHLEWGVDVDLATFSPPFDMILAADVVYVEESFPLLIKSLDDLTDSQTVVLLSCKHRYESYMKFFTLFQTKFDFEVVWFNEDLKVYRARKK